MTAVLETEPPADHDTEKYDWYEATPTILRGTPGDEMSYKLYGTGELELSKVVDGQVVPDTTSKLWLKDPFIGRPETKFTPPGSSEPANVRTGWKEGTSSEEIWGGIRIGLKRESDGWKIPASEQYLKRYRNPNTQGTPDWAIFTITIYSL